MCSVFACVFVAFSVDFLSLTVYLVDVSFLVLFVQMFWLGLLFLSVTCIVTGLFLLLSDLPHVVTVVAL